MEKNFLHHLQISLKFKKPTKVIRLRFNVIINIINMDYLNPNRGRFTFKPRRKVNYYNPTLVSQHVMQILSPFAAGSRSAPKYQPTSNVQALETAKQEFEHKHLTSNRAGRQTPQSTTQNHSQQLQRPKDNDNVNTSIRKSLVQEYELKRAAYLGSLQNSMKSSSLQHNQPGLQHVNNYNYRNDEDIYRKQNHKFNIISLVPDYERNLREYHKLTTQDKLGWRLDTMHMVPMTPSPPTPNPEKY